MPLTVMMALGRWEEFRLHVKAAFSSGLGAHAFAPQRDGPRGVED